MSIEEYRDDVKSENCRAALKIACIRIFLGSGASETIAHLRRPWGALQCLLSKRGGGTDLEEQQRWRYTLLPNGLGQSHIGIKGIKPIASNWSFIFNLQTGFDPYSLQLANGPRSLAQNNTNPLDVQSANGDSSRAGQIFNTVAYAGVSNPVFGTLTAGRQGSPWSELSSFRALRAPWD